MFTEQDAVGQVCQRVMPGHVYDLRLGLPALRDVLIGHDPAAIGRGPMHARDHTAAAKLQEVRAARILINRIELIRAFFERAEEACTRAEAGEALSAIMIDIDHFKRVNDQFGHGVGDEALCAVARLAAAESDTAGRLGGEEFAILLEGSDVARAGQIAERLRLKFERLRVLANEVPLTLTCSLGISEWQRGDSVDGLLRRADMALYQAKSSGRNRVVAADATLVPTNDAGLCGVSRSLTRSIEVDVKDRLADQTGLDRCMAQA